MSLKQRFYNRTALVLILCLIAASCCTGHLHAAGITVSETAVHVIAGTKQYEAARLLALSTAGTEEGETPQTLAELQSLIISAGSRLDEEAALLGMTREQYIDFLAVSLVKATGSGASQDTAEAAGMIAADAVQESAASAEDADILPPVIGAIADAAEEAAADAAEQELITADEAAEGEAQPEYNAVPAEVITEEAAGPENTVPEQPEIPSSSGETVPEQQDVSAEEAEPEQQDIPEAVSGETDPEAPGTEAEPEITGEEAVPEAAEGTDSVLSEAGEGPETPAAAEDAAVQEEIPENPADAAAAQRVELSDYDYQLLAALIFYEAVGEPYEGMVAVANVVINRMLSSKYPSTLQEVVYQRGQFQPAYLLAGKVRCGDIPEICYRAADEALNGAMPVGDAIFFMRKDLHRSGRIIQNHCFWGHM